MKYRVAMTVVIRILYLVANLVVLLGLDSLLLGHYVSYGKEGYLSHYIVSNRFYIASYK